MDTILTANIWKQVAPEAKRAERRLVAVAYVSNAGHLSFRRGDLLICDASDRAIKAGETSARVLEELSRKGVEIRSRPDLHAKVAILGSSVLVGSCNLSDSSAEVLTELAVLTDRRQVLAQAAAFIYALRKSSEEVNQAFLQRIRKIRVRQARGRGTKRKGRIARFGRRVWLISLKELAEEEFPDEQRLVEKAERKTKSILADEDASVSWARWSGRSRFRSLAQPGDVVVRIWRSLSGKRTEVLASCPIIYRQDASTWTRFYFSGASAQESLPWTRFSQGAKKGGLPWVSKESTRELSPRQELVIEGLWE